MLQVHQLSKSYGTRVLFEDVTFALTPGERLGLVGRNGTGKTTLFKLILGEESPDGGKLDLPKHYRVGHLSQHLDFTEDTVLKEACLGLPVQDGGWVEEYLAEQALAGLGFSVEDFDRPPSEFSGGFQVRLQLAKVLVSAPNLLLLDEPTNYLDIVSMRWLERYLRNWDGEVILITHDREFMDRVTTHTMVIHRAKTRRVSGGTAKLYEMLEVEEEIHEKTRLGQERSRRDAEKFVERFRYKASKAKQVQSRIKMLEKQGQMEQLAEIATLSFKFNAAPFHARTMLRVEDLEFGYEDGPSLIDGLSFELEPGERLAVIGKNGKGKSTLLNLIAGELTERRGGFKRHDAISLAHFGQTNIDRLQNGSTVEEEVMSAVPDHSRGTARAICGLMMFSGDDALKKVDVLSGGERARVLLGKLLVSPANLVLLDEPTNHLDMESIESLIEALEGFPGGVVIVTHNERVLHALATKLIVFDRGAASWFDGGYQDFLDRVGWGDEDDIQKKRLKADKKAASKQDKPQQGKGKQGKPKQGRPEQTKAAQPKQNQKKPAQAKKGGSPPDAGNKARRQRRAAIVAERSKALRPLQKVVTDLEAKIVEAEEQLETANAGLAEAAQTNDKDRIVGLSTEAADLQKRIEQLFEELEKASTEHDWQAMEFDRQLEDL